MPETRRGGLKMPRLSPVGSPISGSGNTQEIPQTAEPLKYIGKYYAVSVMAADKDVPASIDYFLLPGTSAPDDYVSLHIDLERTLAVIRVLFPSKGEKFKEYFWKLADIAMASLGQDQVRVGRLALTAFQDEIVTREAGHVKNAYIQRLGGYAIAFGVPIILFYLYSRYWSDHHSDLYRLREFISMVAGSLLGTWLSFSIRRVQLSFWDLARLEEDLLDPAIRLIFVGGLTVVVGLLLATKAVVITIGGFNSAFLDSGTTAVLIGCLCGIGEIGLSAAVGRRASEFVSALSAVRGAGAAAPAAPAPAPAAPAPAAPTPAAPTPAPTPAAPTPAPTSAPTSAATPAAPAPAPAAALPRAPGSRSAP